jgi:hypothetical protein
MNPNEIGLTVENEADKMGNYWRMTRLGVNGPDRFKNPHAKGTNMIQWQAPPSNNLCIVILGQSPLERNGQLVANEIVSIPAGKKSEMFKVTDSNVQFTYEYAALVEESDNIYAYVSGENSPPGIVVEPHP